MGTGSAFYEGNRTMSTPTVKMARYMNFGNWEQGRVVTSFLFQNRLYSVVYAENNYGGKNLVLVDCEKQIAIRHGNAKVLQRVYSWGGEHKYTKAMKFITDMENR
jgi:hypothetical protein